MDSLETYIMYVQGTPYISKQNCTALLTSLQWPAGPSQHLDNYGAKAVEAWGWRNGEMLVTCLVISLAI